MCCSHKLEDLKKRIAEKGTLLVAYSGGVDSSLLAKVANDVLGENAFCVLLDSETLPRSELKNARELAKSLGLNFQVAKYSVLEDEEFVENPASRCYLCKKKSSRVLKSVAEAWGTSCIADGVNLSDYDDYRPGIRACGEEGIWHPFVEAQITKQDIRDICLGMGLSFWNKPSSACLSSRIPYGQRITEENIRMVEEAEDYLKSLGFRQLRVRYHSKLARIELLMEDMERALTFRADIVRKLKSLGFDFVTFDLEGFRSGSLNEVLWTAPR
jgi:uncharacterized protein